MSSGYSTPTAYNPEELLKPGLPLETNHRRLRVIPGDRAAYSGQAAQQNDQAGPMGTAQTPYECHA